MTNEDIALIKSSWEKVLPISEQAAALFYRRLFDVAPELQGLFKGDMLQQGRLLMHMIDTAVNGLESLDQIIPTVQALGRRHVTYGVKDADYDAVAAALLWTLEQGLGEAFSNEVRQAWIAVYTLLADTMKKAAAEKAA